MKKWIIQIILCFVLVPVAVASVCCEIGQECIIAETCQDGSCGTCTITIYKSGGGVNVSETPMIQNSSYLYLYNATGNLTDLGAYPYVISCDTGYSCQGDCQAEVKQDCSEGFDVITGISIFLILINFGLFYLPFKVKKFTENIAGDYVVKRMIWMAGIVVLWFNMLIFRMLAVKYNLGIDAQLKAYWWFLTLGVFSVVLIMCYVMVIGALKLTKEVKLKQRMGDETAISDSWKN